MGPASSPDRPTTPRGYGTPSTGAELLKLKGHTGTVKGVALTPDGARIVTGSTDNTARVWDASTGAELLQLKGHTGAVWSVALTPDGARIVTGSDDKTARVWDAGTGTELLGLKGHTGDVSSVALTPTGPASSPARTTRRRGYGTPAPARSCSSSRVTPATSSALP